MWDPQWTSFAGTYRLLRVDLAGFGRTPIESLPLAHARDLVALLDELEIGAAAVIGASLGGRVALEVSEVRAPTLAIIGEEDVDDVHTIARRLAAEIPQARLETIPGAAHLPSLEQPEVFDRLVLPFLADALG